MRALIGAAAICAAMAMAPTAKALENGNELYDRCTEENYQASAYCMGYLSGITQTLTWWSIHTDQCFNAMPAKATNNQAKDVVVKFLRAHPEDRDISAVMLVAIAFAEAWPCE